MSITESEFVAGLDFSNPLLAIPFDELNSDGQSFLEVNNQEFDIRNKQTVSSYNWIENPDQAIIIVPGLPKRLTNWRGGQLEPDTLENRIYEKYIPTKKCQMQALFVAVQIAIENGEAPITDESSQKFKFQNFDFATDRNGLRKLFRFLENNMRPDPIRIDIQLINDLICLIIVEKEDLRVRAYETYGRDFEHKMALSANVMCSGSYNPIISYDFGCFKILMRFGIDCADLELSETDAEAENRKKATSKQLKKKVVETASYENVEIEGVEIEKNLKDPLELAEFLEKVSINSSRDRADDVIKVISYGDWRQYHLVEVGTRNYYRGQKSSFPNHVWNALYFPHIPTFILGHQNYGKVGPNDIELYTFKQVEEKCGGFPLQQMARLHDLMKKISEFVRKNARQNDIFSIFWEQSFGHEIKIFRVQNPQRFAVSDTLRKLIAEN